jgi:hypothetical protein
MPSEDGDLVSKLSAWLSEEIKTLPMDGKDHQLTIKIKGNRGHINLGHPTFDTYPLKHPPPQHSDPHPQCMRCDHNHHDQIAAQKMALTRQRTNNRLILKTCVACIGIAAVSFSIKDHLPEALKAYALIATGAFGCLAFMLVAAN